MNQLMSSSKPKTEKFDAQKKHSNSSPGLDLQLSLFSWFQQHHWRCSVWNQTRFWSENRGCLKQRCGHSQSWTASPQCPLEATFWPYLQYSESSSEENTFLKALHTWVSGSDERSAPTSETQPWLRRRSRERTTCCFFSNIPKSDRDVKTEWNVVGFF